MYVVFLVLLWILLVWDGMVGCIGRWYEFIFDWVENWERFLEKFWYDKIINFGEIIWVLEICFRWFKDFVIFYYKDKLIYLVVY